MDCHVLYDAVLNGSINNLRKNSHKVEFVLTPSGDTLLHLSSQLGKTECVKEILSMHPSLLLKTNPGGATALHLAARNGHGAIVQFLIDSTKTFADDYDLESGTIGVAKRMLRMTNEEGDTPLHEATRYEHLDVVRLLLWEEEDAGECRYQCNKRGESPLYMAAHRGNTRLVSMILKTGKSVAYGGPNGRTALHGVVLGCQNNRSLGCMHLLMDWKPSLVETTDVNGQTPLHYAAITGFHDFATTSVMRNRSVACIADKDDKNSPLHLAAKGGDEELVKDLMSLCPEACDMVNIRDQNMLHNAVEHEKEDVIEVILKSCPVLPRLLSQRDTDGNTPLHLLALSKCYNELLITHKMSDCAALNNKNLTPLDILIHSDESVRGQGNNASRSALTRFGLRNEVGQWFVPSTNTGVKNSDDREAGEKFTSQEIEKHAKEAQEKQLGREAGEQLASQEIEKHAKEAREKKLDHEAVKQLAIPEKKKQKKEAQEKQLEKMKKMADTHMIVAALLVTITFTAGFTMPGGYDDGNEHLKQQGMAILTKKAAFKTFIITDTIALLLATAALVIYFMAASKPFRNKVKALERLYDTAFIFNLAALGSMMVSFVTGTYAALAHSCILAIVVCVIGCCFFLFLCCLVRKWLHGLQLQRKWLPRFNIVSASAPPSWAS